VFAAGADDLEKVDRLLRRFSAVAGRPPDMKRLVTLRDEDLGEGGADLYHRTIDDEAGFGLSLVAADPETVSSFRPRFSQAIELLRRADAELAEEVDVFGRQIVLACGKAGELNFSGAATFFLWGALLINPRTNEDPLSLAETLAHESGHALLFALCDADPMTLNDAEDRYPSPLRTDPRPIEGIVHATYVLARMERVMRAVYERCAPSAADLGKAREMADASRRLFLDGLEVVRKHARFSEAGRAVFEPCLSWV
jgi:HEXXH motif-containing protein